MRPALHRLKIAAGKLDLSSRERTTSRIAGGDGVSHEATDIDHPAQCEQRARSQPIGAVGIRRNGRRRKLVGQVVDTKQIKTLISDSVEEVSIGTRLVQLAGTTMTTVMDRVGKVNDIVARISAASREKSVAIDEVNRAIAQMDQTTQQNAALVEEAAAAAQSMQNHAVLLNTMVSVFRLASDGKMSLVHDTFFVNPGQPPSVSGFAIKPWSWSHRSSCGCSRMSGERDEIANCRGISR
jgi:hypothetical protein